MNDENSRLLLAALKEISDNQKLQLALQREQFALVQRQAERYELIQDRAENIQAKGAQIMAVARRTLFVILPIVTFLILYVSWLLPLAEVQNVPILFFVQTPLTFPLVC